MKPIILPGTFRTFFILFGFIFLFSNKINADPDTIYANIPVGQFGVNCVDLTTFPGTVTSIHNFCPSQSGVFANFFVQSGLTGCVNYFGIVEGPSLGCFEICDDQMNCDTVYIFLNTDPPTPLNFNCDTLIEPEIINSSISDCAFNGNICLPIELDDLHNYDIYTNGVLYDNGLTGCEADTITAYSYINLFGNGNLGPYLLESWIVNGTDYSGPFNDMPALLDSMNFWDPMGLWVFNTTVSFTITGGFTDNTYGPLIISKPGVPNSTAVIGANFGLDYAGSQLNLPLGVNEITIVDDVNSCADTVLINVACLPNDYLNIQNYVNSSGSVCVDTSDLIGNFASITEVCINSFSPGVMIDIFPGDVCVDWELLIGGTENACLVVCDDMGFCDTTFITFEVIDPTTDTIDVILPENTTESVCLDSTELIGNIDTLFTLCAGTGLVTTNLDTAGICLEITSTIEGSDTLCYVICDDEGGCDTTIVIVLVDNIASGYPDVNDDVDSTNQDVSLTLNILANDIFGATDIITITSNPTNGTITMDSSGNYIYTPNLGFCGIDFLTYEVCNLIGCTSANVSITVVCDGVKVYNGFSPNGDDINDYFRVDGLAGFPEHEIFIFNRWGALVHQTKKYKSDWTGFWQGKQLSTGTYFYVIALNDAERTVLSGAVEMQY